MYPSLNLKINIFHNKSQNKLGLNHTKKLHSKGNHQQNEKAAY